ncbi:MAG: hypothetical protein ACR2QA_09230 [Solirubrobacteraceae bacterium]
MDDIAGIILGVIAAGLLIALTHGGWNGPGGGRAWWDAKFLGKV